MQVSGIPLLENRPCASPCAPARTSTALWCSPHQNPLPPFALSAPGRRCPLQRRAWWTPGEGTWKADNNEARTLAWFHVTLRKNKRLGLWRGGYFKSGAWLKLSISLTLGLHWTGGPGSGLCPGGCRASPASGGCVPPPLSPAVCPPVPAKRLIDVNRRGRCF